MYLKKLSATTDPHLRSLVQKAVRRGYSVVARKALEALHAHGDDRWIRSRCAVLAAEECWPLLVELPPKATPNSRIDWICSLAGREKFKDAAGLGTLAYAVSEDDLSPLSGGEEDKVIRVLAAGIKRPEDFWAWMLQESEPVGRLGFAEKLRSFISWPTWPWDKAFVLATAYLTVRKGPERVGEAGDPVHDFPFWIAIDKHTPEGKTALRRAAKAVGCSYRQLNWVSYYLESARIHSLRDSDWWLREQTWRLRKVDLSVADATELWARARTLVEGAVAAEALALKKKIETQRRLTPQFY